MPFPERHLLWVGAFLFIAGFIPPSAPSSTADAIVRLYSSRTTAIKIGMVISMLASALLVPYAAAISGRNAVSTLGQSVSRHAAAVRAALKKAGFDPGAIDGRVRDTTMGAVNAYQRSKNLPVDPYINIDTVKALGIDPRS